MRHRLLALSGAGIAVVLIGALTFGNLNRDLVYYFTPTEAVAKHATDFPDGRRFRLGGYVEPGSVTRSPGRVTFVVDDGETRVRVTYAGAPSQLFGPGIGVIVEGAWRGKIFASDTMIVKHDENYRPPTGVTPTPRTRRRRVGAE